MSGPSEYLEFAKDLAQEAGEIMLKYFEAENIGVELKSDDSPVTLADTEVNSLVISKVKQRFADHGVLGEEESFNLDSDKLWIVDPLDGTSVFARGLTGWVFSLAYVEDGATKLGVVYDPVLKRLFWAVEGEGAYENNRKLALKDEIPSGTIELSSWVAGDFVGVIFKNKDIESKILAAYNHSNLKFFPNDGPIAHVLALTAAGRVHGAVTSCKNPWDVAAGSFIAHQAGATVTDLFGKTIKRWDKDVRGVLAAPPKLHAEILKTILPVVDEAELQ